MDRTLTERIEASDRRLYHLERRLFRTRAEADEVCRHLTVEMKLLEELIREELEARRCTT